MPLYAPLPALPIGKKGRCPGRSDQNAPLPNQNARIPNPERLNILLGARLEPDPLVGRYLTPLRSSPDSFQPRNCRVQVATEPVLGSCFLAVGVNAPVLELLPEEIDGDLVAGSDNALVAEEGLDRRSQHFNSYDLLDGILGLNEVAAIPEPPIADYRPVQYSLQFGP